MKRVLIIAYYFPPMGLSGVQRTAKLVKYLGDFGWEPTVISVSQTAFFAHDQSLLRECTERNIRVLRTTGGDPYSVSRRLGGISLPFGLSGGLLSKLSKSFWVPDNKISWSRRAGALAAALCTKEKFDLVYISAPPFSSLMLGPEIKKRFGIPFFADYRDLWLGYHFAFYPTPLHRRLHRIMEERVVRAADRIAVTNDVARERMLVHYPFLGPDTVTAVAHGYDGADFEGRAATQAGGVDGGTMVLTHSGTFYEFITPRFFLEAFGQLLDRDPQTANAIELHFAGHMNRPSRRLVRRLGLSRHVKAHGYLDHESAVQALVDSDVLWLMIGRHENADTIAPSRLFEYFGARKPIIACVVEGAARTAAEAYGASFITQPDDVGGICRTLKRVHELYRCGKLPAPDKTFVARHDRRVLTEALASSFDAIVR